MRKYMLTQDEELQAMWINREAIERSLQRFVTLIIGQKTSTPGGRKGYPNADVVWEVAWI